LSDSIGVPLTVTASLKPSVSAIVSPACSLPVPGEAEACATDGATLGVVGVVGEVGCVGVVGVIELPSKGGGRLRCNCDALNDVK
jgi:hypothetical protein